MSHFTLFSNDNVILLQPNKPNRPVLKISRPDCQISLLSSEDFSVTAFGPFDLSLRCYAIYGMIELLAGKYLIVVSEQSSIGPFPGSEEDVRQVTGVKIIPCGVELKALSSELQADEKEFLSLLESSINQSAPMASGLYYSPTVALSKSLQSQFKDPMKINQWKLAAIKGQDPFAVNSALLSDFSSIESESISDFICVCIQGFVEIRDLVVNHKVITFALISRRNVARTGARYHCRGIDSMGHVANFVETEQILFTPEGKCASFLQIRGSIPLFWRQNVRIKYKPELEIHNKATSNAEEAFRTHRDSTIEAYGHVSVANLVDSHGGEAQLSAIFRKLSQLDNKAAWKYVEFDFHMECRKMAYHNISKLIHVLENELNVYGYFEGNLQDGRVLKNQTGVVRTNCMDCLDRTNVVQSVLAKRALLAQLKDFKIIEEEANEDFGPFGEVLVGVFRNVWADNADAISTQYSGTGALKTDFTRTGKRSPMGALQDGINSALRYYFGNFSDGARQDSLDLLFGAYKVDPSNYISPFRNGPVDLIKVLVTWALILLFILFFLFAHFALKKEMLVAASLIIVLMHYVRNNGKRFTQKPRLIKQQQ